MKKVTIKSTIVVFALTASCLGAWRAYGVYGNVDNSLLMENLEALAQDEGGDASGDSWFNINDRCIVQGESMRAVPCIEPVTTSGVSAGVGVNGGGVYVGTTCIYNKYKLVCQPVCSWHTSCDRREQTDCDGNKLGEKACLPSK